MIGLWTAGWLEIWTIGLWTVRPFDYNLIQMDDYPADSCVKSPSVFLLLQLLVTLRMDSLCHDVKY